MLNAIVRFSLKGRGIIVALAVLFLVYGGYTLSRAKYDVFPEFATPQVSIQTEAPGLSPEQVEVLVTQPVENGLNGIAGIQAIRSQSIQGLSVITINFDMGSNIYLDRQAAAERLSAISGQLPQGIGAPVMEPLTSSTGDLMTIGLVSDTVSPMELRTLAEWTVRPRLLAVPGVAKASIWGGQVRQMQIQVDPQKLVRYDLSIDDVLATAQKATGVRGGGFIEADKRRVVLQLEGQSLAADELAHTALVHSGGAPGDISALIGDVARVVEAPAPAIGAASVMGKPAVVMNLWAQYGANTLETTRSIDQALADLGPALERQGVRLRPDLFRSANFVQTAVSNIRSSLLIGGALVIIVLFLFLMDFRTSLISCTAIPLSLLAAITILERFGLTLNTMTLGGLAIATGEVVDDAVIDVENILRRLRENRHRASPLPALRVVLEASIEVRHAVIYAAAAVCLVFQPILAMSGLAGSLFRPLALTYIFSILASLCVALTLTPSLCLFLLGNRDLEEREPPLVRWLKARYRAVLAGVERHPRLVIAAVLVFTLAGFALVPFIGGDFLPEFHEGHFIIHVTAPPGTSLDESLRLGAEVTDALLKLPFVRSVAERVGRAAADDTSGPHESELEVDLKPLSPKEAAAVSDEIRKALEPFKDLEFAVNTFLAERIEETLSGYTSSVVVTIFGKDLDVLDQKTQSIFQAMEKVPGVADTKIQAPPGIPQLSVHLRPETLLRWGLDPVTVLDTVNTAYQGKVSGQIYQGNQVFDLAVLLDPGLRRKPEELGALRVRNAAGTYVQLKDLADIRLGTGRYAVLHEAAQRVQTITCNVQGRDMTSFMADLRKTIGERVSLPAGMYVVYGGTSVAQAQSQHDLIVYSLMAGVVIVLLLSTIMGHWRNLVLVLLNLPMALVGGVLAVAITRQDLSIGCLVGFVTLFGITLRNSIMMITHFEHLVDLEGMSWGPETAIRGASERLTPVLMTALVTALGLLPLALGSGAAGREIEGPMALVILGGLFTSAALNLLVLPTLALRFGRFEKKQPEAA
jgi:CzcA family heavy metal efflux pump